MNVASNESRDRVTVVLPVFRIAAFRDGRKLSRPNEYIRAENDDCYRNQPHHHIKMQHILKFVVLPSKTNIFLCD